MKSFSQHDLISNLGVYLHTFAETSQDVFWVRGKDYSRVLYVNPAYETVWGGSCKQLYENSASWIALIHPEDREECISQQKKIKSETHEGEVFSTSFRVMTPKGYIKRIQETVFPLFDKQRDIVGYVGIAKDISQNRVIFSELDKANHFLYLFADQIHAVFWGRDMGEGQTYLSPGYEKIWGRTRESLYRGSDSWVDTIHPEDRPLAKTAIQLRALHNKSTDVQYELRYRIVLPDKTIRWIKDVSFPIRDENKNYLGFAGMAEDITKEVQHEQELHEAKLRAEVANQAKSDFLALVSHELRTPLNAILGVAQILKAKVLDKEMEEYIDILHHSGNNLLILVNDILDLARLETGKLYLVQELFDLRELINQITASMKQLAKEKRLLLTARFPENIPSAVIGDPHRLRQIFVNLIGNAIKFTETGSIDIAVLSAQQNDDFLMFKIAITDTGMGIPEDKLAFVFERFSQVDPIYRRKHHGIGLGLSITKNLVEAMGGHIQVASELGRGSTFYFTLLLKPQDASMLSTLVPLTTEPKKQRQQYSLHVLLVEDNLLNQRIATTMLEDFGCKVTIASCAKEVFDQIDNLNTYHVIFMDIGLPDVSGFDIVSQLRREPGLQSIMIVAMTAHVLERDIQHALSVGMNKIIAKPIRYEEIEKVLKESIDK